MIVVTSATMVKAAVFSVIQALALSGTVVGVVHSALGPFAQAIIIALVGSIITALGVIIAAHITAAEARKSREDIKAAHGGRRKDDE